MTVDLDLVVQTAEEHHHPVGAQPRAVAGPVHPAAGLRGERVGAEALLGEVRPGVVAGGHARPADPQLAGDAEGQRTAVRVEDVQPVARVRAADRQRCLRRFTADVALEVGVVDGGLGDTVRVDDPSAGADQGQGATVLVDVPLLGAAA